MTFFIIIFRKRKSNKSNNSSSSDSCCSGNHEESLKERAALKCCLVVASGQSPKKRERHEEEEVARNVGVCRGNRLFFDLKLNGLFKGKNKLKKHSKRNNIICVFSSEVDGQFSGDQFKDIACHTERYNC